MTLSGRNVTLRPLAAEDLPALVEALAHPILRQWWGDYDTERLRADYLSPGADPAYVILDGTGERVGMISHWEEAEPEYRHAGMDIFLAAHRHGEGLAADALRTLARHLIDEHGHHRLVIDPAAGNERAITVYKQVGFRPVGVMRRAERSPDGEWRDVLLMEMLADELTG